MAIKKSRNSQASKQERKELVCCPGRGKKIWHRSMAGKKERIGLDLYDPIN